MPEEKEVISLDIAKAMKVLRKKNGWSQGEIFRRTGLERGYISKVEAGIIKYPKLKTIFKIAAAFGIKASEFIDVAQAMFYETCKDGKKEGGSKRKNT